MLVTTNLHHRRWPVDTNPGRNVIALETLANMCIYVYIHYTKKQIERFMNFVHILELARIGGLVSSFSAWEMVTKVRRKLKTNNLCILMIDDEFASVLS